MPDDHRPSLTIGSAEPDEYRAVREALGKATPQTLALADALRAREADLSVWLQDPANRKQLAANPTGALAQFVAPEVLKAAGTLQRLPADVVKRLSSLQVNAPSQPQTTPEEDLFEKVWAYVSASQSNLAAFQADIPGTVRSVDPAVPQPVVDAVVAAYDQAAGIYQLATVDPGYFTGAIANGLATLRQAELP